MTRFFEEPQYHHNHCLSAIAKGAEIFLLMLLSLAVTILIAMFLYSI
jgi:hypothetical protein